MTTRRSFLAHLTATAAGLLVADDALEMLLEPRRKLWRGWSAEPMTATRATVNLNELIHEIFGRVIVPHVRAMVPHYDGLFAAAASSRSGKSLVFATDLRYRS